MLTGALCCSQVPCVPTVAAVEALLGSAVLTRAIAVRYVLVLFEVSMGCGLLTQYPFVCTYLTGFLCFSAKAAQDTAAQLRSDGSVCTVGAGGYIIDGAPLTADLEIALQFVFGGPAMQYAPRSDMTLEEVRVGDASLFHACSVV